MSLWSAATCRRFLLAFRDKSAQEKRRQVAALHIANIFTCAGRYSDLMLIDWPHAPVHRLDSAGIYMVTAGTLNKEHLFADAGKLTSLQNSLLSLAKKYHWQLEAWAVFSNHYHFIGRSNPESVSLKKLLTHLHADSARDLNSEDGTAGREVWFNYWDTKLTYERSYLARLNYVHQNPVKHGLVPVANQYEWCSAGWFERVARPAMVRRSTALRPTNLTSMMNTDLWNAATCRRFCLALSDKRPEEKRRQV